MIKLFFEGRLCKENEIISKNGKEYIKNTLAYSNSKDQSYFIPIYFYNKNAEKIKNCFKGAKVSGTGFLNHHSTKDDNNWNNFTNINVFDLCYFEKKDYLNKNEFEKENGN